MEECKSTFEINIEKFLEQAKLGYEVIDEKNDGKTMKLTGKALVGAEHNELTVGALRRLDDHNYADVSIYDTIDRVFPDERGETMHGGFLADDPLLVRIMEMIRYDIIESEKLMPLVKGFLTTLGKLGEDWEFNTEDVASASFVDIRRTMTRVPDYSWRRLVVNWKDTEEGKLWFALYPKGWKRAVAALCDGKKDELVSVVTDLFAVLSEMDGMVYGNPDFTDMLPKVDLSISNIAQFSIESRGENNTGTLPGEPVEGLGILDDSLLDMLADDSLIPVVSPKREEYGAITALYDVSSTHTGWDFLRILSYEKQGKIEWTMNGAGPDGRDIHKDYVFDEKSSKKLYRTMSLLVEAK